MASNKVQSPKHEFATPFDAAAVYGASVQLPTFDKVEPEAWFAVADANFALGRVLDSTTKYYYVLSKLDNHSRAVGATDVNRGHAHQPRWPPSLYVNFTGSTVIRRGDALMVAQVGVRNVNGTPRHVYFTSRGTFLMEKMHSQTRPRETPRPVAERGRETYYACKATFDLGQHREEDVPN